MTGQPTTPEDRWLVATSDEDGVRRYFRMRDSPPVDDLARYPYLISIQWTYDGSSTAGMPEPDLLDQMNHCESAMDPIEAEGVGCFVASITGNGQREWLWYVRDKEAYMSSLNAILAGQPRRQIDLEASEDPDWNAYRTMRARAKGRRTTG